MRTRAEKSNNEYIRSNKIRSECRRTCVWVCMSWCYLFMLNVPRDDCRAGRHAHSRTNGNPYDEALRRWRMKYKRTLHCHTHSWPSRRAHTNCGKTEKKTKQTSSTHTYRPKQWAARPRRTRAHTLFARHTVPTDAFRSACERAKQRSTLIESNSRMLLSLAGVVRLRELYVWACARARAFTACMCACGYLALFTANAYNCWLSMRMPSGWTKLQATENDQYTNERRR